MSVVRGCCQTLTAAELGHAIRRLRRARHLTIEDLAHAADMHPTYLSGIERGVRNPSWAKVSNIATALGVSVGVIVQHAEIWGRPVVRAGAL